MQTGPLILHKSFPSHYSAAARALKKKQASHADLEEHYNCQMSSGQINVQLTHDWNLWQPSAANRSAPCSLHDCSNESQTGFSFFCSLTLLHEVIALQPSETDFTPYYSAHRAVLRQQKALQFAVELPISKNDFYQQHTRKVQFPQLQLLHHHSLQANDKRMR